LNSFSFLVAAGNRLSKYFSPPPLSSQEFERNSSHSQVRCSHIGIIEECTVSFPLSLPLREELHKISSIIYRGEEEDVFFFLSYSFRKILSILPPFFPPLFLNQTIFHYSPALFHLFFPSFLQSWVCQEIWTIFSFFSFPLH